MPLKIPITEKHAQRITALIQERDTVQKDAQDKITAKNEILAGLIEGHIIAAGGDPEAQRGNTHIELEDGKPVLTIDDAPGPRVPMPPPPHEAAPVSEIENMTKKSPKK